RMGINTGYCNVGNFGSRDRLSYTIIGAEVNLAARLQEHCAPGEIALAQETYVHVKDLAPAREADPIHAKGISNPVTYFVISDELATPQKVDVALAGMELKLDVDQLSEEDADRARRSLRSALTQLDRR
ncbi:MAG: adenylate/guanylate cyclase domain-containing protein, partial [Pseudomonadota bacterium]